MTVVKLEASTLPQTDMEPEREPFKEDSSLELASFQIPCKLPGPCVPVIGLKGSEAFGGTSQA